ncbi:MAG: DNA translocase FtsK [Spirochaetes bacterium]|nr:DNA translocase FtsK [Spirochaetota bacterium]
MFRDRRYQEILGIILVITSVLLLLSISSYDIYDYARMTARHPVSNLVGIAGVWIGHGLRTAFGLSSFILPLIFLISGWSVIKRGDFIEIIERLSSLLFLCITTSMIFTLARNVIPQYSGGLLGQHLLNFLRSTTGSAGSILIVFMLNLIGLVLVGVFSITAIVNGDHGLRDFFEKAVDVILRAAGKKRRIDVIEEDSILKKSRMPWITKKRIVVYEEDIPINNIPEACERMELSYYPPSTDLVPVGDRSGSLKCEVIGPNQDLPKGIPCITEAENAIEEDFEDEDFVSAEGPVEMKIYPGEEMEYAAERLKITGKNFPDELGSQEVIPSIEDRIYDEIRINKDYIIPTTFLNSAKPVDAENWKSEVKKNSLLLVNTLADFCIESKVVNVNRGPVITLYELQIAPGIKVNKIVSLSDDIAMALAASRVRIVAPIPGKSAIGIEIPNTEREEVTLGDIVKSGEYSKKSGSLKVALGKDILGNPVMLDLKKLPHLLIAGATGSGKSVCVNVILTSLLYNYDPNYVRFILVDPKMVELQLYNGLPHLLTPVITEPYLAPMVLKWATYEMERRYRLLSEISSRDIEKYNDKIEHNAYDLEKLPFIVIIIDELADLMMVASKEIEGYITRISQKARAVGIHMVLATQRPSVDIITGIIKANFPARIAFQVPQKTDSRTIIDQNGAEKLLGKGDMLYQSPVSSYPIRVQGAFISEEEILNIVTHLKKMGSPNYIDIEKTLFDAEAERELDGEGEDELFVEALKIVEETRKASASYLQRRLSIGYNRAARMIELMEVRGYVGPQQGSKPREVLI